MILQSKGKSIVSEKIKGKRLKLIKTPSFRIQGFSGSSLVKNLPVKGGDMSSIPGWGRSPGDGNSNPFQYSCLGNPMDGEAWWATYSSQDLKKTSKKKKKHPVAEFREKKSGKFWFSLKNAIMHDFYKTVGKY